MKASLGEEHNARVSRTAVLRSTPGRKRLPGDSLPIDFNDATPSCRRPSAASTACCCATCELLCDVQVRAAVQVGRAAAGRRCVAVVVGTGLRELCTLELFWTGWYARPDNPASFAVSSAAVQRRGTCAQLFRCVIAHAENAVLSSSTFLRCVIENFYCGDSMPSTCDRISGCGTVEHVGVAGSREPSL